VKTIKQTRFKLTAGVVALFFIEGLCRAFFPGFPLTEVVAAQGLALGGFLGAKTTNNIKYKQFEEEGNGNGNGNGDNSIPLK